MPWPKLTDLLIPLCLAPLAMASAMAAEQTVLGEQLYLTPPKDWTVAFHNRLGNTGHQVDFTELVPAGQTVQDWKEMVVVQMLMSKPSHTPQEILEEQLPQVQQSCEAVEAGPIQASTENGYDSALRVVSCSRNKRWGKGEINVYRVIRGRDRTYVLSRSWRGEAFAKDRSPVPPDVLSSWSAYLLQAVLCDSRDAEHPCPARAEAPASPAPQTTVSPAAAPQQPAAPPPTKP